MSTWSTARKELADVLKPVLSDWTVSDVVPEKAGPPLAIVDIPEPPYIDFEGATFGGRNLYLEVIVAVPKGSNDVIAAAVDEALEKVLDAVEDSDDFVPTQVSAGPVSVNGQIYPGGIVRCRTEVRRG